MKQTRASTVLPAVLAGLVTSVVVAAVAFANGATGGQAAAPAAPAAGPPGAPTVAQLVLDGKTMQVLGFSAGVENTFSFGSGGGGGVGKPTFAAIEVTKPVDANTPWLNQGIAMGKTYPKAVLTAQWGTGSSTATLTYELDTVFVQSARQAGTAAGAPTETLSLLFGKILWVFDDTDGKESVQWNVGENTP